MKTSRISLGTMLAAFACVALAIGISVAAVGPSPADARDAGWQQGEPAMGAMAAGSTTALGAAETAGAGRSDARIAIPVPQGKSYVYDGAEKNALGRKLFEHEGELWLPESVVQVSLGADHSAAVTASGELYTWGDNTNGQLGDGTTENRSTPVKVEGLEDVVQVSLGYYHSAAVTASGELYTWGVNRYGQLGDGTTEDRHAPVKVEGLEDVVQVSLGYYHSAAVTDSGELYTWGWNSYGQLGDGTTEDRHAPAKVGALEDVVQVSLGVHSAAVTSSGDLYTWGLNHRGQLGDGTTTDSSEPAAIDFDRSPLMRLFVQDPGDAVAATDPGSYRCYAEPGPRFKWEDGTTGAVEVGWSISSPWARLGGATRYDTMSAIVERAFPEGSDRAVLVSGANFPDALSAASLAGAYGCPIVTTKPGALSAQAKGALERLGAETVFIVGGPKAVSPAVEESVRALNGGTEVERVCGKNRYDTALEVMRRAAELRPAGTVFVATGEDYPDALAASPVSYAQGAPIVLVDPDRGISDAQLEAIAASGADRVVVLGGEGAVPGSVESELRATGIADVTRIAGATRYETAVGVAAWATDNGADLSAPVVATALKDADALAGAALAGGSGSVLLLADEEDAGGETAAAPALDFLAEHAAEVRSGCILGGEKAISEALAERILAAVNGVMAP